jgi:hypothetical protein
VAEPARAELDVDPAGRVGEDVGAKGAEDCRDAEATILGGVPEVSSY